MLLHLPLTQLFPGSRNPGSDLLELRLRCNNGKKIGSDSSASPLKPLWSWDHHPLREFSSSSYLCKCKANYSSLRRSFLILLCIRLVVVLFPASLYNIWDISSYYSNPANQLCKNEGYKGSSITTTNTPDYVKTFFRTTIHIVLIYNLRRLIYSKAPF